MQTELFHLNSRLEMRHWWFVGRRKILHGLITALLPASRATMIVDVGCGTGGNVSELSKDYTCVGVDPSAEAIELAKARFPDVHFVRGLAPDDLGELMRQAKLFLMTDVLEHVPDDFALLSRLLAAASPGAYFLLTVPADLTLWSVHDEIHGHYRRYDRQRLERVWQGLPVKARLVSYFNCRLYPLVKWVRRVGRWRGSPGGEAGSDFKVPGPLANRLLERVFRGEGRRLNDLLAGKRGTGYPFGVSLVAILQREMGEVVSRNKPADLPPDRYDPVATATAAQGTPCTGA